MKTQIRITLSDPHPHLGPLISSYQDDLATSEEVQVVEEHLQTCERCHHFYQNLQLARELVHELPAFQPVSEQIETAAYYAILEQIVNHHTFKKTRKERNKMNQLHQFEHFSEPARQVLVEAQEEANRFNHNYIGTEHLLLGLLRQKDSAVAQLLARFNVELSQARNIIEGRIGRGNQVAKAAGEVALTRRAKRVFEFAVEEARSLRQRKVEPEHLLLGLMREKEGVAAGTLITLGVSFQPAQQQIQQLALDQYPVQEPPQKKGLRRIFTILWRRRRD